MDLETTAFEVFTLRRRLRGAMYVVAASVALSAGSLAVAIIALSHQNHVIMPNQIVLTGADNSGLVLAPSGVTWIGTDGAAYATIGLDPAARPEIFLRSSDSQISICAAPRNPFVALYGESASVSLNEVAELKTGKTDGQLTIGKWKDQPGRWPVLLRSESGGGLLRIRDKSKANFVAHGGAVSYQDSAGKIEFIALDTAADRGQLANDAAH